MTKKPLLLLTLLFTIILGFALAYIIFGNTNLENAGNINYTNQEKIKGEFFTESGDSGLSGQYSNETHLVVRVIDGDTIEIEGGQRVRYIGIDTPETVHPDIKTQCFGTESSSKNKELVEGKRVRLEKDISETDKYGRLLRYVYVGDVFVNDFLVSEGYANSSSYPPDIKFQEHFTQAQNEARENNRGLWKSCGHDSQNQEQNLDGCLIKGNISSTGNKIYHMPGQRYYDRTVIDEAKGESWFCTEEDATRAGFRKSKV